MKIGEKINHLTLLEITHKVDTNSYGNFECDCESKLIKNLRLSAVKSGGTKSCGCHRRIQAQINGKSVTTHGLSKHPLFIIWTKLHSLCYNVKFHMYLGGSINICQEWKDNFQNFYDWAISNGWSKGLTIIRIDSQKDFSPDNCKLVTSLESYNINTTLKCNIKYGCNRPSQNEDIKAKAKQTNLDRYGVTAAIKLDSVKEKTKANNIAKYGVEHPNKLPENRKRFRDLTIKSGQAKVLDGKTATEWAKEKNLAPSCVHQRIRKFGYEEAVKMEKNQTDIEYIIEKLLISMSLEYKKEVCIDKYRADFMLQEYSLIIEANGLYWHSDSIEEDKFYHRNKYHTYAKCGYNSLFFREDEIYNKLDIIKSIITNKVKQSNRLYARKCIIKELTYIEIKSFLTENHLMGCGSGKGFGLFLDNNLVTVMQIVQKKTHIEISRFCHQKFTTVVGGLSKLLKYIEVHLQPPLIKTFIDKRYGSGEYLEQFGFRLLNDQISFIWVRDNKAFHRMTYPGNSGYDHRCAKFWDCGQASYIKTL